MLGVADKDATADAQTNIWFRIAMGSWAFRWFRGSEGMGVLDCLGVQDLNAAGEIVCNDVIKDMWEI